MGQIPCYIERISSDCYYIDLVVVIAFLAHKSNRIHASPQLNLRPSFKPVHFVRIFLGPQQ